MTLIMQLPDGLSLSMLSRAIRLLPVSVEATTGKPRLKPVLLLVLSGLPVDGFRGLTLTFRKLPLWTWPFRTETLLFVRRRTLPNWPRVTRPLVLVVSLLTSMVRSWWIWTLVTLPLSLVSFEGPALTKPLWTMALIVDLFRMKTFEFRPLVTMPLVLVVAFFIMALGVETLRLP